ncbi:hypothetical protein M0R45_025474 [Rubus argutus]|uniref:Uncharacterized protein n=1 Tax=Rubus argutus TaxID=59490 RepID=A0AAW1WX58_RUBAR
MKVTTVCNTNDPLRTPSVYHTPEAKRQSTRKRTNNKQVEPLMIEPGRCKSGMVLMKMILSSLPKEKYSQSVIAIAMSLETKKEWISATDTVQTKFHELHINHHKSKSRIDE